ncbi:MAG: glycosyl transferase, group 1 [Frankiales bacterium]|nr:glycosyl transferase, group 1 [Frankiales bacterium]
MRVVVVVPWEPWRITDGVVLPLHHHLHELSGRHQIVVLAAGAPSALEQRVTGPDGKLPDGVLTRWFGTDRSAVLDYAVRRFRSEFVREPAHTLYVERPRLLDAFAHEARDADVVHLVGWGTAQLAARIRVPAVHYAVDPWAASWRNRRLPAWRRATDLGQRAMVLRHEQRHYPQCHSVAVVAQADADLLAQQVPAGRYDVVPNGVVAGPDPAPAPTAPVLGFHGAFETQANVDGARALVERIWPRVRAALPDATVLLVGREPSAQVQALVQAGVVLKADVPSVRAELDRTAVHVSWMPSGMGLKNKVLEAMAAGRPVVANERGASGIGAGDGLYVAADEDSAARHLVALLRDQARRAAEGEKARRRVLAEYTWTASARRVERLWEQAAS